MDNIGKSILIFIFIGLLQLLLYIIFLQPVITTWGASAEEVSMQMAGDEEELTIMSTRAITVNAPKSEVWQWLMQLGADRGGFYSYYFIERALGYITRYPHLTRPKFKEFSVGDVVRGSIDEAKSVIPYSFMVLGIKSQESLVLDKWGTFLVKETNSGQTRLVIRTQEAKSTGTLMRVGSFIVIPLHYIMERRMLMGIKAHAEAKQDSQLSETNDFLWIFGVILSGLLICLLVVISRGLVKSVILPLVLSSYWLATLLILDPIPLYSMSLLLIIFLIFLGIIQRRSRGK